jgi:hypothetical protein
MAETKIDPRQIKLITAAIVDHLLADGAVIAKKLKQGMTKTEMDGILASASISAAKLFANGGTALTEAELSYLKGVTSAIQTQLNARFLTSNFVSAPNNTQWSSTTIAISAKAILDKINELILTSAVPSVSIYNSSEIGATVQLSALRKGDFIIYDTWASPPAGHKLEVGDIVIVKKSNPSLSVAGDWVVAQANLAGAVTSVLDKTVDGALAVFSGSSGTVLKDLPGSGIVKLVNGVATLVPESELASVPIRRSFEGNGTARSFGFYSEHSGTIGRAFMEVVSLNGQVLTRDADYTIISTKDTSTAAYSIALVSGWFTPMPGDRIEVFAIPFIALL